MTTDETSPDAAPAAPRPWMFRALALGGRAVGCVLVVGALSVLARPTVRTAPPEPPGTATVTATDLGIAFVPAATLALGRAAPAVGAGRLRLEGPGDPARIEPPRGPQEMRGPQAARSLQEQTLGRGDFSAIEDSHLRLTLTRDAAEPAPGLFVTLARRAAEGLNLAVVRTGTRGRIATKFGAVETLEATLSGSQRRVCTGFVTLDARPARIDGWLCAPLGRPPEPRALACTLDALVLEEPADAATNAVFAEAERRRDPACDPVRALSAGEPGNRTGSIVPRRTPRSRKPTHG